MPHSYDLTKLDANTFEHLVNLLALRVLGAGHSGFGPGPDGGRDGYFEGEASYPSADNHWKGVWYIQSKFHAPHLSADPQKWLLARVKEELEEFQRRGSRRKWPDNWIVATNIDPSGAPETGAFDVARELVKNARPELADHFDIWGGRKLLQLLVLHPEVAEYYKHFLTPGHILTEIYSGLKDARAEVEMIINHLLVRGLTDSQYTKLEQAGASGDARPGIHRLFIDLPFVSGEHASAGFAVDFLARALGRNHQVDRWIPMVKEWRAWNRNPVRARAWFLKGGPGQGKSTVGQFICQVHRAALILQNDGPFVIPRTRELAVEIIKVAEERGIRPTVPRIPIVVELREYAQWFGSRKANQPRGILTYLADKTSIAVEVPVLPGTFKRAIGTRSWLAVFDGLDEVPHDVKDDVAKEVRHFVDDVAVEINADLFTLCTSRPQGYSGQFADLEAATVRLSELSAEQALKFAAPVLSLDRSATDAEKSISILQAAIKSPSVRELMKSPLQAHIMAVVVRDGGRPPERRWHLFTNFYEVIRRREGNREVTDSRLSKLLREEEQIVKTVHSRLGFVLHAKAETSEGAVTRLARPDFRDLVAQAIAQMMDTDIDNTVDVLMNATTERLVLVNTPDDGNHVRFDIRPLQEFFAAEFLYEGLQAKELGSRLEIVCGDAHWREVIHFLLSALIESGRRTELSVAIRVLEALDEGEVEEIERLPSKRMARGALLAARLLNEGVLEQDKRNREQFRNVLRGLCGLTDPAALTLEHNESHAQSANWFVQFLFDSLSELSLSENVGSSILLMQLLEDGHPRVDEFADFLRSTPKNYLGYVLSAKVQKLHHSEPEAVRVQPIKLQNQTWLLRFAVEILRDPDWFRHGALMVGSLIRILLYSVDSIREVAPVGVVKVEMGLITEVLRGTNLEFGAMVRQGHIGSVGFEADWTTGISDERLHTTLPLLDETAIGFWAFLQITLRFGISRTFENFQILRTELLKLDHDVIAVLPESLRAFIPGIDFQGRLSKAAISLDEAEFQHLIGTELHRSQIGRPTLHVVLEELPENETSDHAWQLTAEFSPEIALDLFWTDIGPTNPPEHVIHYVVDRILEEPQIALSAVRVWGNLLRACRSREDRIRTALIAAAETRPPFQHTWAQQVEPFPIRLPSEAALLPHIASAILGGMHIFREVTHAQDDTVVRAADAVCVYFPDPRSLQDLLEDPAVPTRIRAGALLLLAMHREVKEPLALLEQYAGGLHDEQERWYTGALAAYLKHWTHWTSPATQRILAQLLEATREDYPARESLQRLFSLWREASTSPVTSRDLIVRWLSS